RPGAINVSRDDPECFGDDGGSVLAGCKYAVDFGDGNACILRCIADRFEMQRQMALVRQIADLVAFRSADYADLVGEFLQFPAPVTGRKWASVTSEVMRAGTNSTAMPIRISLGSGLMPTRLVESLGPSSSSTMASTKGTSAFQAG